MGQGIYLTRSQSSSEDATARKKFTISGWYKLAANGDAGGWKGFWSAATDGSNYSSLKQNADGFIIFEQKSSGTGVTWTSSARYRDYSSWYHIMVAYDSTQASNTDRVKVYINGSIAPGTHGSFTQDQEGFWGNSASTAGLGRYNSNTGSSYMYTGYATHIVGTIGYALAPTVFGETDSTTGEWKPRTSPSGITYSANGFYLKFENSNAMGADSSGNTNTFTVNGTGSTNGSLIQTTDVPSNNFCTLNPLAINKFNPPTISAGSLLITDTNNGNWRICGASHGFTGGKWYWETQYTGSNSLMSGILNINNYNASRNFSAGGDAYPGKYADGQSFGYRDNGTLYHNGNTTSGKTQWGSAGDILGIALDMENNALYAHVNGTYVDSGDPTSGASKTGSLFNFTPTAYVTPAIAVSAANTNGGRMNFGNPQFTISSSNADANGYGSFEYAVPSGYYAICTENLALYGG